MKLKQEFRDVYETFKRAFLVFNMSYRVSKGMSNVLKAFKENLWINVLETDTT